MKTRSLLLSVSALCIGAIIAVILGEGMLRLAGVQSSLVYRPDPNYGWGHTPGISFDWTVNGSTQAIRINSLGLRDKESGYDKSPNIYRMLVLGDSFAEALQVPLYDRFSNLAESQINDPAVEILNSGASGYGTDNALLFYRHEGFKYQPDKVVLALYVGNDIRNNWYRLENIDVGGFRKPYFELIDGSLEPQMYPFSEHAGWMTKLKVFINQNLVLYSFLRELRNRLRHSGGESTESTDQVPLDMQIYLTEDAEEWTTAYAVTDALLAELQEEVRSHGAELLVVLIPSRLQVHRNHWEQMLAEEPFLQQYEWDLDKPVRLLTRMLSERNIDYLDLLPSLQLTAQANAEDLYIAGDGHWNAAGHKVAAGALRKYFLSEDVVMQRVR